MIEDTLVDNSDGQKVRLGADVLVAVSTVLANQCGQSRQQADNLVRDMGRGAFPSRQWSASAYWLKCVIFSPKHQTD
jgi:hypothetical protein